MSLPAPKLDDRTWSSLVEESKLRIAAKCPDWTDFNASDPGMALVEVMAWMTETALYRLNRVPDLNYIKYLELIGVRLQPARPASTWVFFDVQPSAGETAVPAGTRISTRAQSGREPVAFVTRQDLHLTSSQIKKTASRYGSPEQDVILNLHGETPWESDLFSLSEADRARAVVVAHNFYLGDPTLARFGSQTLLEVHVQLEGSTANYPLMLEWQAWTGESWNPIPLESERDETQGFMKSGTIVFEKLPLMKKCSFEKLQLQQIGNAPRKNDDKTEVFWLRAHLGGSTAQVQPLLLKLQRRIKSNGCVTMPHLALAKTPPQKLPEKTAEKIPFRLVDLPAHPLDLNADASLFGAEVIKDSLFFLSSELFQHGGAEIDIEFKLRTPLNIELCEAFEIDWEYQSSGKGWKTFGKNGLGERIETMSGFHDGTKAFTQSGKVTFTCPEDLVQTDIGGQPGWFIRARVDQAAFKHGAKVEIRASSVLLGYKGKFQPWGHCISENYSEITNHSPVDPFEPFFISRPQSPAFYICLDRRPTPEGGPYQLFLEVIPQEGGIQGSNVLWEYSTTERHWAALDVRHDSTGGIANSGMVQFVANRGWSEATHFDQPGYWLRVRWELSQFLKSPRLKRVLLNGVEVEQTTTLEHILGSSDGSADQSFSLNSSVLDNPELWVRETDESPENIREVLKLGKYAVEDKDFRKDKDKGWWVKWTEVETFHTSMVRDFHHPVRHFTANLETGTFTFGDAEYGSIPPPLSNNIKVVYRVTQGARGNVGSEVITVIDTSLKNITGVRNYHPAQDGSDPESIEKAKMRGPWQLRHQGRAVTEEDFVRLAERASQQVGKAYCYERDNLICVVVVPKDEGLAPCPSRPLIDHVTAYLNARKLINTRLRVEPPKYKKISVQIDVALKPSFGGLFSDVADKIKAALNDFVHPLIGLEDNTGWERGRALHDSELYYLIESLPEVDWVDRLELRSSDTQSPERRIELDPDFSFPTFDEIKVNRIFG
jgi:hypothetical protein